MTNIDSFDPYVQQAIENRIAAAQAAARAGLLGGPSGTCWNWATSGDDYGLSNENTYSAQIPKNKDGTINFHALYIQLQQLIKYAINGDQADYNSQLNIAAMLVNIGKVWGQFSVDEKALISNLLNPPNGPSVLAQMSTDILKALIYGTFYYNNGNQPSTLSAVQALLAQLDQAFGGIPVFANFLAQAHAMGDPTQLKLWMAQNTNKDGTANMTFQGFVFFQTMNWEKDFSFLNSSDSSNTLINQMNSDLLNMLLKGITDPWEIMAILFCSFFCDSGLPDFMTQIGGNANLTNAVTHVGDQAKAVQAFFQANAGKFTWAQAQTFFQDVASLNTLGNGDLRFVGTIGTATNQFFNDVCDPQNSIQVAYNLGFPPNNNYVNVPLAELYQATVNQTPITVNGQTFTPTQAGFLNALNGLAPVAGSGQVVPAGYTQLQTDMGQIQTSVTAKSSAVGQIVSNLMSIVQKFEALLTAMGNSITQAEKTMTTASASAGN